MLLDVVLFSGNDASNYIPFHEMVSNIQYKPNYYICMLPISFHHEDGLFLQLQISIFLEYILKNVIYAQFLLYVLKHWQYK